MPETVYDPAGKTAARKPAPRAQNPLKLAGVVVGVLGVIVGLALMLRRPSEPSPENAGAQPASPAVSSPAPFSQQSSSEAATRTQAHTASSRTARAPKNVPAPAAPPAATEGQLIVTSVPMGAAVEIEGRAGQSWKAPGTISGLAPGTYKVTFSMPGYAVETRTVQVSGGARMPLDVRLNAVKGFITIAGSPAGAEVFINDRDTGKVTPIQFMVEPGAQNVTVRKAGFLDANTELKVVAGQSVNYAPSLMVAGRTDNIQLVGGGRMGKMFGGSSASGKARIEIKSEPKGAQVVVNGTPLQKTTPVEIQVEPGNYDITIQKDGYKPVRENAIVGIDDRIKIDKALSH